MKYFLVILLLCCFGSNLSAQEFRFSQFDLNPIYMNPAYSGSQKDLRIGINYRNQWFNVPGRSLPGPLSSYNLVVDKSFGNVLVGGLSANIFQSFKGEGQYKHTHAGFNYSWHLPTKNEDFSMFFPTESDIKSSILIITENFIINFKFSQSLFYSLK